MNPPDQPTPTQPTATPRTDAHIRENGYEIAGVYVGANVHPDFARQLETELAAAKAEREMLAKCHTDNCASITQLAQELNAARASAMADFEYFHEIRVRITEICGDPYLLHPEALEAIAAELARLRDEVERLKITAETVSLPAGAAHPTMASRVGLVWIQELLARAEKAADRDVKYTIDLDENCPNGACNCADFMTRCQKEWDKTKKVVEYGNPQRTRCKHINAAVMFLGNTVIESFNK